MSATVVAENLRLTRADCEPASSAVHVGISGRHRHPVTILVPTSNGVLVRFPGGEVREVQPADLARDPAHSTITNRSREVVSNAVVEVETYHHPETLTEPVLPTTHGVYVECREVLELDQARAMRDALICAVRQLERLEGN